MKFDYVIGNPPYQENKENTSDAQIYNYFMDASYRISNKVMLITPGKFLFNAGKTPKVWNEKMLSDSHLKVVRYYSDSKELFGNNVNFGGGVVITYRDNDKDYGAINIFSTYPEINSIVKKIISSNSKSINEIMILQNRFNLEKLYNEYPNFKNLIGSDGKEKRLVTSIFKTIPIFHDNKMNSDLLIHGIENNNQRISKYVEKKYIEDNGTLKYYKVLVPKAYGTGFVNDEKVIMIGKPFIANINEGFTQSFISVGYSENEDYAENTLKYLKTKFCRAMLGILKATQDNPPEKWKYVPLQDFTEKSDIEWTKSIHEIDLKLYEKYGLEQPEIDFIESHIKEMN